MSINLEFKKDDNTKIVLSLKETRRLYQDLQELLNINNAIIPAITDYYPPINSNINSFNGKL